MERTKKRGLFRTAMMVIAGGVAAVAGVFSLASLWVNSVKLPEELKKPPMKYARFEADPEPSMAWAEGKAKPSAARSRPSADLTKYSKYKTFLIDRIAADPRLSSASLYLELLKHDNRKRLGSLELYKLSDSYAHRDNKGIYTINPQGESVLRDNADLFEKIHRLAHVPEFPVLSQEERQAYLMQGRLGPKMEFQLFNIGVKMMTSEGRWRRLRGDHSGAGESFRDALALAEMDIKIRGILVDNAILRPLTEWVEDPKTPATELARMLEPLERADQAFFPRDRLTRLLIERYLLQRATFIQEMERGSWRSHMYGWNLGFWDKTSRQYMSYREPFTFASVNTAASNYYDFSLFGRQFKVPRLHRMPMVAVRAMHNKRNSVRALTLYDELAQAIIEKSRLSYPQLAGGLAEENLLAPSDFGPFKDCFLVNPAGVKYGVGTYPASGLQTEAKFRLIRLGVQWRLDRPKALKLREGVTAAQPHHIWRDPYTERPFRVLEATSSSAALLYSLGPDLIDQQGASFKSVQVSDNPVRYKRIMPGDLSILIPETDQETVRQLQPAGNSPSARPSS